MIKIRIKNADHEIDIRFPISESELFAKLGEIHAVEGRDAAQSALVTDVYWPEEFSMLKDRFANLDELNYLGKRMYSRHPPGPRNGQAPSAGSDEPPCQSPP